MAARSRFYRLRRGDLTMLRQVLVIKGETPIRNILSLLRDGLRSGGAGCDQEIALSPIQPDLFDAILLDLRSLFDAPQSSPEISKVHSRPMGRTLYLIAEVSGPEVFKMIEQHCARSRNFVHALWLRFWTVFSPAAVSKQVEFVAGPEKF